MSIDSDRDLTRLAIGVTLAMLVLHLLAASHLELMFDEAYYRLWAHHLAWGYHDHPPAIAAWIRISTTLFGPSEFGVRALGIVATAFGSLAVYLIAQDLFDNRRTAAMAVLLWAACPLIGVGAMLVTPDTPLLFGWTLALWGLGRLYRSTDWRWWLVIGLGAGLALQAKYTALFLGPGLLLAMLVVPGLRRWWSHPGPYLGGALAMAIFAPNIAWNAMHGWETFAKQFGRVAETEWTLRFLLEFFGSQIGLLNPLTFVLVVAGLMLAVSGGAADADGHGGARRLLAALVAPLLVFFAIHSLHDRVQGNWLAPMYPVFVLLAADAASNVAAFRHWQTTLAGSLLTAARRWAVPVGLGLTGLIYLQALAAPFPVPPRADPTALLSGWRKLAADVAALAAREHAGYVLTQGYALTGLLKVYGPATLPVSQFNERYRWAYDTTELPIDGTKPGLFVVEAKRAGGAEPRNRFAASEEIARLDRTGRGGVLETYVVFRLTRPVAAILDSAAARGR